MSKDRTLEPTPICLVFGQRVENVGFVVMAKFLISEQILLSKPIWHRSFCAWVDFSWIVPVRIATYKTDEV